jgi:hypothetical protein
MGAKRFTTTPTRLGPNEPSQAFRWAGPERQADPLAHYAFQSKLARMVEDHGAPSPSRCSKSAIPRLPAILGANSSAILHKVIVKPFGLMAARGHQTQHQQSKR